MANAHRPSPARLAVPVDAPRRTPSPAKQLPLKTSRESSYLQSLFVGLAFHTTPAKSGVEGLDDLHWFIAVSDGFAIQNSEHGKVEAVDLRPGSEGPRKTIGRIVDRLRQYAASQSYKIQLVAISEAGLPKCFLTEEPLLLPALWQKLDTVPFLIPLEAFAQPAASPTASPSVSFFPPSALRQTVPRRRHIDLSFLPEAATDRAEGEDRAQRAVREAVKALSPLVKSATTVETDGQTGEVEVDRNGQIQLASLADYEATTSPELWAKFLALSKHLQANKIKISFFSATPQGGGVALMRHALIRLWRLAGVDAKWFVPEGHPLVWAITKQRFHNVLQGVSKPGVVLEDEHKEIFEKWTEANLSTFWSEGAIEGRIVVIDDPQLCALIPHIRERYPGVKVLFRSHIQIDTSLTDVANVDADSKDAHPARDVWLYLWSFIREADLFVAHPVRRFVPKVVTESAMPVTYMPPSTDPLDGLNKPIGAADMQYWRQYFSRISEQQCGVGVDWARPYIMQVARFDPSKGIPVLLEAYLAFRQKLRSLDPKPTPDQTPQLVIAGHGSVDDPDGQPIFEEIADILHQEAYQFLRKDVAVVRVPPCDRTLGAILQGAWCATQLSTKEGFEVKVTEAVHKRVPIIIADAGGMPLQVRDGINGYIVPSGESQPVADRLFSLWEADESPLPTVAALERANKTPNSVADETVGDLLARPPRINPSAANGEVDQSEKDVGTSEDFWSVGNAVRWMTLFARLGPREHKVDGVDKLATILGEARSANPWEGIENRSVWETVLGERDDKLVID